MAGLNFPENAVYYDYDREKVNVAPFELIPWILGQCASVEEAKKLLENLNLVNINFSEQLPLSPLHWMVSDGKQSIVIESLESGLWVYENPFEILTNNPGFDYHRINICNYMGLGTGPASTQFQPELPLYNYSLGMGALGLPGDFSSASRFVKAFFVKENAVSNADEKSSVNQFFHMLNAVAMPKGCVWTERGFEYTRYSSCCNVNQGIYYYTTYNNLEITSISMHAVDLESCHLYTYAVNGLE
jgi:choloylglycine hydrolase